MIIFKVRKLKKEILLCKSKIQELESKRSRSQSALVQAILEHTEPDEDDVKYFNHYTNLINETREKMHALQQELNNLK